MKTTKKAKALLSLVLVLTMLLSMCVVGFVGVSAAGTTLNYEFAYQNAGYAEGRLSLSGASGTYILYWADDTKALEGYTGIAQITVASGTKYFEMPANTAIPADATKVIAVKSGDDATVADAAAVFDIPQSKQFKAKSSDKQYTFEALSDIHIQHDDSYWYLSKTHFANALEVAAKREVDFITISGDMVNGYSYSNLQNEYPQYLELIAKSNYNNPIYETNGNHEMKGGTAAQNLELYKNYTGLNTTTGALQSTPYYEKTINGDHYIFLVLELSGSPNESSEFTTAQLDWFEGLLKKYSGDGHKIIVNQHALIKGYGAGDNKVTPYYGGALQQSYAEIKRLMSIMEAYPEIIMMSGHSHIDFKYGYNFDNESGNTCYTVHIPSTSSTTHPNASGGLDYTMDVNSSQGYLVDVYDDYVILNGTDLAFNLICPSYTYMVDYTGEKLIENELSEIVYNTVEITVDVSALTDAPESVVCVAIDEANAANNQSIPMTRNADGTYSAKVIEEYSQVYFAINGTTGVKTSAFPVANCKIILGYQTLTYTPANSVSFVRAHVWGGGGDGTTWPGVTMTKGSDGSYSVRIPASDYTGVVFNWGDGDSNKSQDLAIANYITETVADTYISLDGGDTTEPATNPKETEAITTTAAPTKPATEPSEGTTAATEPSEATTAVTEPTETTTATEPVVDELAPIVIIEETDEAYFLVDAYAADGSEDVEFKFSVNGKVYQDYSDISTFIFAAPSDYYYIIEVSAKYADGSEHKTTVMFEVKDGVALLPEMPERPTTPSTEPTEVSTPDETTPDETAPTTETTAPAVEYLYGDADLNGKVNVKDATTIQKYAAKLVDLDETAMIQADVTGDMKVNVKDATSIQKLIAKIIDKFPVEEGAAVLASVGATVADLKSEVKTVLSKEYQYASYDAYMALKKAYMNSSVTYDALNQAYTDYKTMKSKNSIASFGGTVTIGDINIGKTGTGTPTIPGPSIGGSNTGGSTDDNSGGNTSGDVTTDMIDIYFVKPSDWEGAYLYAYYGDGTNMTTLWSAAYPGNPMTFVETDANGNNIYVGEVPEDINTIKFADGSATNRRTDIIVDFADGICFQLGASFGTNKWYVEEYAYTSDSGNTDSGNTDSGNNSGGNSGADTTPSGTASSYVIHGNLSGSWADVVLYVSTEDSNIATATMDISAGSYEFVMHNTGTDEWIKNGGTIDDTCEGWRFGTDKDGNTTFNATGGTYVFNFDLTTLKLTITKK